MFSVESGLDEAFSEIAELSKECRLSDCTHIHEIRIAALQAVGRQRLPRKRCDNHIKMGKESDYNEMSYLEKLQKDREFGKMYKSVMKLKKNRRRTDRKYRYLLHRVLMAISPGRTETSIG